MTHRGSRTSKVEPLPGPADVAVSSPPWARTMLRAMVSPIPLPPAREAPALRA